MKRLLSAVALLAVLAGGAPSWAVSIDSNDKLLVQSNNTGTPGTFLDTSSGAKTVTTVGGATQIPYKISRSALFFDGSSNVLVPDHADFDLGSGDFTVEMFIMPTDVSTEYGWVGLDSSSSGIDFFMTSSTNIRVWVAGASRDFTVSAMSANTWYHVAVVRESGNVNVYLNGTAATGSGAMAASISSSTTLKIGSRADSSSYFKGWMKEIRVSNTARYTSSFTPTTTEFSSDSNTKLLLHGNTSATYPLSPWIKVDGTGDYMTIPDAAWQDLGTGDLSIEASVRWNSVGTSTVAEIGNAGSTGVKIVYSASTLQFVINGSAVITPSFAPVANRNYHIAGVRSSGTVYLFADGVLLGSGANSSNITGLTDGVRIANDQSSQLINGWLRNVRISNIARYTAAFTPPTAEFTSDANTMFLLHGNAANGSTTMTDSSSNAATITVNGDTKIDFQEDWRSTIITDSGNTGHKPYVPVTKLAKVDFVSVFGNGSGLFDGSGDYLTVPDHADWDFGTGDFAIEGYYRFASVSSDQALIECGNSGTTGEGLKYNQASGQLRLDINGATVLNPSFTPSANTWYHFAATRGSGTARMFINGSLKSSAANSSDVSGSSSGVYIGHNIPGTGYFNGWTDNNRISNVARYTATFDPADSDFSSGRKRSTVLF